MENLANNHYLLSNFVRALSPSIGDATLVEVYKQNSREYVFQLAHADDHISLTFFWAGKTSFVFSSKKEKPKHGAHLYFRELMGKQAKNAGVFANDRSFFISFEDNLQLVFKLYGQHANVILFQDELPVTMLRQQFQNDWKKHLQDYHNPLTQTFEAYEKARNQYEDTEKAIKALFPALPKDTLHSLESNGFFEADVEAQWQQLNKLIEYFKWPYYFIGNQEHQEKNNPGYFLTFFELETPVLQTDDVLSAYQEFAKYYLREFNFLLYKNALLDHLKKQVKQLSKRIQNSENHLQKLVEGYDYKNLADIIMANLHLLEKGQEEAELFDFFNNTNIKVPLKRELSPQKNAERYYRKGRNQYYEIEQLENQMEADQQLYSEIQEKLNQIQAETDLKAIQKEYKAMFDQPHKKPESGTNTSQFKHFTVNGFDVYAGKGAKTNDALTFKFANKIDLWLHARDRHGSHVIIRNPGVAEFPVNMIEQAAGIAAYYSKGKGEEMCPVIYTRKKYVWKPKGSDPGQVHYKNEEVVVVEPELPERTQGKNDRN